MRSWPPPFAIGCRSFLADSYYVKGVLWVLVRCVNGRCLTCQQLDNEGVSQATNKQSTEAERLA